MSLDSLSNQIKAEAKAEAETIIKAAEKQAKGIRKEAEDEAKTHVDAALARAEKDAKQISVEVVASVRQQNQNAALMARRAVLDAAYDAATLAVSKSNMKGRSKLIKSLVEDAKSQGEKDMVLHPVETDRKEIEGLKPGFKIGESVSGLGGFTLVSSDGSVLLDYRFDSRLDAAWKESLAEVNDILFG